MDAENKMLKSEFSEFRQAYATLDDRVEYLEAITAKIGMSTSWVYPSHSGATGNARLYFD